MDNAKLKQDFKEDLAADNINLVVRDPKASELISVVEECNLSVTDSDTSAATASALLIASAPAPAAITESLVPSVAPTIEETENTPNPESAHSPPFVISIIDIFAVLFVALAMLAHFVLFDTIPSNTLVAQIRIYSSLGMAAVYGLLHTYWFADVSLRLAKATKGRDLSSPFEKLALIHPMLLCPAAIFLCSQCPPILNLVFILILLGAPIRWLVLLLRLPNAGAYALEGGDKRYQVPAETAGMLAIFGTVIGSAVIACAPSLGGNCTVISAVTILITGFLFVCLRNFLIQTNPITQSPKLGEFSLSSWKPAAGEVLIRYNHFVEMQKWFKQRMALHSPWKMGLLALITIAAIASNLHTEILNAMTANFTSLATTVGSRSFDVGNGNSRQ
jgi:hypothetical protein